MTPHPLHISQLKGKAFKVFTPTQDIYAATQQIIFDAGINIVKCTGWKGAPNMGISVKDDASDGIGDRTDLPPNMRINGTEFLAANQ